MHPVTRQLLVAIERVAADLDSQGPLARPWVETMTLDEVGQAFEMLTADRHVVLIHYPGDAGGCAEDRQPWPCRKIASLRARYLG